MRIHVIRTVDWLKQTQNLACGLGVRILDSSYRPVPQNRWGLPWRASRIPSGVFLFPPACRLRWGRRPRRRSLPPRRDYFIVQVGINPGSANAPDVVEDNERFGHRRGEFGKLGQSREGQLHVQGQPMLARTRAPVRKASLADIPSASRLSDSGSGLQVTLWRMPLNRLRLAACNASNTGATPSPSFRSHGLQWPPPGFHRRRRSGATGRSPNRAPQRGRSTDRESIAIHSNGVPTIATNPFRAPAPATRANG